MNGLEILSAWCQTWLPLCVAPAVDLALVLSLLELGWWLAQRRPVAHLGAGLGLMVALRLALGASAPLDVASSLGVLLGLSAAGLAHLTDLRRRFSPSARPPVSDPAAAGASAAAALPPSR